MNDERLRRAWAERQGDAAGSASTVSAETVWDAVQGDLPATERHKLIERMARDPELAAEWRLAKEIVGTTATEEETERPPAKILPWRRGGVLAGLAAAAVLLIVVFLPFDDDTVRYRGDDLVTRVEAELPLDRENAVLRWNGPEEAAHYEVVVSDLELEELFRVSDLETSEVRVPAEVLTGVEEGILWQVIVYDTDGEVIGRPTTFRSDLE